MKTTQELLKALKNDLKAYLDIEKKINKKKTDIEIAMGCDDFDTIEKQKKAIELLNEKLNSIVECACGTYGCSNWVFIELVMEYELQNK